MTTTEIITLGLATLDLTMSVLQTVQYQMQAMTNYADIYMAPGKFGLDLLMTIFQIPPTELGGKLYIGIAFVIATIIWLRCLRMTFELIKSTFSRW